MKRLSNFLSTVWLGLSTHKLRSFLTMLGIIIGVASVITLMSIGKGSQQQILSNIESLGANLLTIRPGSTTFGGVRGAAGSGATLTVDDADAISQQVPYVSVVAPSYSATFQLIVGALNTRSQVVGVTPAYQITGNLNMAEGAFISDYDYQNNAKVAVIGANVASTLFPSTDPLGQPIRMGSNIVYVVGVLQSKGVSIVGSADDTVLVPMTALRQMSAQSRTTTGAYVVSSIALTVSDTNQTQTVVNDITALLRTRHNLKTTDSNDFNILSVQDIANTATQTIGTLTLLLGAIAAISLLVGGIGVMNIMLVSVLERTREIGIRKALGARNRDIWEQFLVEAALLTFAGGIIGVIVGWSISRVCQPSGYF